jgi:protein TonB
MPRDLFGDVTRPFAGVGARSRYTVPLSLAAHTVAVVTVVVVPLLATNALPVLQSRIVFNDYTPVVPSPPPPPRPEAPRVVESPAANPNAAPTEAPTGFAPERDVPTPTVDLPDGLIVGGIEKGLDALTPPPAPPRPQEPPKTVRPGGNVKPPEKVHDAAPVYPAIAQAARVQGIVIIQATIGVDGRVVDATVLRSVPLLDGAAIDAVRRWRYTPTTLNGQPVAVVMTVTVNFTLR